MDTILTLVMIIMLGVLTIIICYKVPSEPINNIKLQTIPKHVFQTHRSQEYISHSPELLKAQNSWKQMEGFQYYFYDDHKIHTFMLQHFDDRVMQAFHRCPLTVMKADLWRYCVIYVYGGLYTDSDTVCKQNMEHFINHSVELVVCPEPETFRTNLLCQWIFAAPSKSPILKAVIDNCVNEILKHPTLKGEHVVHELTGPTIFTNAVRSYLALKGFSSLPENPIEWNLPTNNYVYMYPHTFTHNPDTIIHLFAGNWKGGWKEQVKLRNAK